MKVNHLAVCLLLIAPLLVSGSHLVVQSGTTTLTADDAGVNARAGAMTPNGTAVLAYGDLAGATYVAWKFPAGSWQTEQLKTVNGRVASIVVLDDDTWIVAADASIYKTIDAGDTWTLKATLASGTQAEGSLAGDADNLLLAYSANAGGSGADMYLSHSTDAGETWGAGVAAVANGGQIQAVAHVGGDDFVYLNNDRLYLTTDGGATSTSVQNVRGLQLGKETSVYAGSCKPCFWSYGSGPVMELYRSTDDGATFTTQVWDGTGSTIDMGSGGVGSPLSLHDFEGVPYLAYYDGTDYILRSLEDGHENNIGSTGYVALAGNADSFQAIYHDGTNFIAYGGIEATAPEPVTGLTGTTTASGEVSLSFFLSPTDPNQDLGDYDYTLYRNGVAAGVLGRNADDGQGILRVTQTGLTGTVLYQILATDLSTGIDSTLSCGISIDTQDLGQSVTCGTAPAGVGVGPSGPVGIPGLGPDGLEPIADAWGIEAGQLAFLIGVLVVAGLTIALYLKAEAVGAFVGALLGFGLCTVLGWFPLWFTLFAVLLAGAVFFFTRGGGE